jgi:hypothetical protein
VNRIVVTKRSQDYHACIEGELGLWGCGATSTAAIGDLVSSHYEHFGVAIRWAAGGVTANHPEFVEEVKAEPCGNPDCPIGCPESHCYPMYDPSFDGPEQDGTR